MRRQSWFICVFAFMAWLPQGVAALTFPVEVGPDHPAVRYVGRFTADKQFAWSGSQIEIDFEGTSVVAEIGLLTGSEAALTVVLDGVPSVLFLHPGQRRYLLAEGLSPEQRHNLKLFRRSEVGFGRMRFDGFRFSSGTEVYRPEDRGRRMLVVGDSITCGYGNEAESVDASNTVKNQNGYLSYAAIAARALDADLMMICWSGRGLYRNYALENDTSGTLPKIFDRILPDDPESVWDHSQFVPDVVVVNLGTNDSSDGGGAKPTLSREAYSETYRRFIEHIRADAPEATIFLSIGPMGHAPIRKAWLAAIADDFEDVHPLVYPPMKSEAERGGHWHPSVRKHRSMAAQLVEAIRAATGWQAEPAPVREAPGQTEVTTPGSVRRAASRSD